MQCFKGNKDIISNEAPFGKNWLVLSNDRIEEFFSLLVWTLEKIL